MNEALRPILKELRAGLEQVYSDRLVGVVLFGSQARGDAAPESDIDVAVVLTPPVNQSVERARTIDMLARLCLEHGVVIGCVFIDADRYRSGGSPFLRNVRQEGVAL